MHYDVIVIGAGSMGMSSGYYLAKNGQKVLLLDSFAPPHNKGSHHGETRIIRHAYGEGREYISLALKSQKLWGELERNSGKQLFLPTGVLNAGSENSTLEGIPRGFGQIHLLVSALKQPARVDTRTQCLLKRTPTVARG